MNKPIKCHIFKPVNTGPRKIWNKRKGFQQSVFYKETKEIFMGVSLVVALLVIIKFVTGH